jgi:hypothetical protein
MPRRRLVGVDLSSRASQAEHTSAQFVIDASRTACKAKSDVA